MRTRAIILKKQNTGEYDQLVTCYSEEFGKMTAVAKSALKSSSIQAMHLDVFNLVDFEIINGRATPIIAGAQAENTYTNIKNDLGRLSVAYLFTEIVDRLAFEYQKDENLWEFLSGILDELNTGPSGIKEFVRNKQIEFLDILGYAPNLTECVFCFRKLSEKPVFYCNCKTSVANLQKSPHYSSSYNSEISSDSHSKFCNLVTKETSQTASRTELVAYNAQARGGVCKECFLGGRGGIVTKADDFMSIPILNSVFESLIERKLYSLNLLNYMLK